MQLDRTLPLGMGQSPSDILPEEPASPEDLTAYKATALLIFKSAFEKKSAIPFTTTTYV